MTSASSDGDPIPRGIEALVKRAAVDEQFRRLLLAKRADASWEVALSLSPAEAAMLNSVPAAQLEAIIARAASSPGEKPRPRGRAVDAVLAALGIRKKGQDGSPAPAPPPVHEVEASSFGIRPDREFKEQDPPEDVVYMVSLGIRPDRPR